MSPPAGSVVEKNIDGLMTVNSPMTTAAKTMKTAAFSSSGVKSSP